MKFTTRSRYGTRMLMDVAMNEEDGPGPLRDIAARLGVSQKYLEKLCRVLRTAGYIESVAGAQGGYALKVHPSAIRMGDVVFLLENGDARGPEPGEGALPSCERAGSCLTRTIWNRAICAMRATLNAISLEDMLRDACFCTENACEVAPASSAPQLP